MNLEGNRKTFMEEVMYKPRCGVKERESASLNVLVVYSCFGGSFYVSWTGLEGPDYTLFLGVSVRFLWMRLAFEKLDSVNCPPQCGWVSSNLLRA